MCLFAHFEQFEIGALLDIGMVGLLGSQYCTPPQKVDLLEGLNRIFSHKEALINIFYNYDNDVEHWPVCQKLRWRIRLYMLYSALCRRCVCSV